MSGLSAASQAVGGGEITKKGRGGERRERDDREQIT